MTLCITAFQTAQHDKSQSDQDQEGHNILVDALNSGLYKKALTKELATRLNVADLDTYIKDVGLFEFHPEISNVTRLWRMSFPEALADAVINGNHQRLSEIVIDIFQDDISENRCSIESEFDENPWVIEEVLNAN